ncbi:hypothetical protein L7F22_053327 [Adiantum nelumboides]|nr:hypothetical protein [Adiantum nelumboides]
MVLEVHGQDGLSSELQQSLDYSGMHLLIDEEDFDDIVEDLDGAADYLSDRREEEEVVMEELLQSRQHEEPVEVKSNDSDSESYQGSGDTTVAAFDPSKEETQVWLKRVGLYEFACLPWHSWAKNEFAEQQGLMLKEGKGVIAGDVRLTPKLVSKVFKLPYLSMPAKGKKVTNSQMKGEFGNPIGTRLYYMVRNAGGIRAPNLFWYLEKLIGKGDRRRTPAVGRVAPYLAAIFEHVLKVTPAASSMKTPIADTLMEEGTVSGSKRRKLLLGSPTIDVKSSFKVSWKDLEESDSKGNFFSMGFEFNKSKSKGKKIIFFPSGVVGSAGKNVSDNSLAREGGTASHLIMGIFFVEEATNCLTDLGKLLHSQDEAVKSDKEKLQVEVVKLQAEGKEMTSKILSVAEDFQQLVDGLKTAVDEQFKDLDEKVAALTTENVMLTNRLNPLAKMEKAVLQGQGMSGVLVANSDADVLKQEVLEYAQDMWN